MNKEEIAEKWREIKKLKEKRKDLSDKIKCLQTEIDEELDPGPQQKLPLEDGPKRPPKKRGKK